MIGERIRFERERLGLTQPAFAEVAGTTKRTLIDWEKGVSSPTAVQLSALAGIGVDVLFVLTGNRSSALLVSEPSPSYAVNKEEAALLDNYRHSSPEGKAVIEAAGVAVAKRAKSAGKKAA